MPTNQFSWLHLSDLHIGQDSQGLWPNLRAKFLKDLERIAQEAGPIDLVIFSGDLTQRGKETEYNTLTTELEAIWEVLDKLDMRPQLFSVPGNHDLVRPPSNDPCMKLLTQWDRDPDVIKEFWDVKDNQYVNLVRSAFSNYTTWQSELSNHGIPVAPLTKGILPGDASSSLTLNGVSVGLVGLNSSFLQLNGGGFDKKLALDLRQLNAITGHNPPKWCDNHDTNFLITHHPSSWLSKESFQHFQTEILPSDRFTAHLYGHMHDPDLTTQYHGGNAGRKSYQSSSLFGIEYLSDGSTERVHGYSIGQIAINPDETTWKLWPRVAKVNRKTRDRKIIPDHDNFELVLGHEYLSEQLEKSNATSKTLTSTAPRALDLEAVVDENDSGWKNALSGAVYFLPERQQHLVIRPLQQQACIESIRKVSMAWVCSDWGLGRDGFLWSVTKRLGRENQPVYRLDLNNYSSRDEFLTKFSTVAGCSFPEFCKTLATTGPAILLFDETPVSIGENIGPAIERDAEKLAHMVKDFCPEVAILLLGRTKPKDPKVGVVTLDPLDEADTRTYLLAHPDTTPEQQSRRAVSAIHRHSDGLPGKIESTLKTLRVVSLSELGGTTSIGQTDTVVASETIPASLIRAVTELAISEDRSSKRSYLLLKVLATLPHGESIQRLKRVDSQHPIFPKHAEELLDLDLIQVRSSTTMIGIHGQKEDRIKILFAPRSVRDYVLSQIPTEEIDSLIRKVTSLYFGETWRIGEASLRKLGGQLTSDDGSLLENPHFLVLQLLEHHTTWETPTSASQVLNLCTVYCASLLADKHYRNCVTVCRDVLSIIPDSGFDSERNAVDSLLTKALRMAGEKEEARSAFKRLLKLEWAKTNRIDLLIGYALCLQSLNDQQAIRVAKEVITLSPNSARALQAKSIILEMEDDANNYGKLLKLEKKARTRGYNVVANNLALDRVENTTNDDDSCHSVLREVHSSAINSGDSYTAARAVVKLGVRLINEDGTLSNSDRNNLISAYQYFYGERFSSQFLDAHKSLWDFFERQGDVRNLLSLFRHSSFIWRLHGNEDTEQVYAKRLIDSARPLLTTDILTADKNTAYFLVRARNEITGPDTFD